MILLRHSGGLAL